MMKRLWALAAALALLCLPLGASAEAGATATTVLVYLSGSNLESDDGSGTDDIREIVRAGIPSGGAIRVLLQTGGAKKWRMRAISAQASQRFSIDENGLELLETNALSDMGQSDTLADFIVWGMARAPAQRYILVLWGHGCGALEGVCYDDLFEDDMLTMPELAVALEAGLGGETLDVLAFDACLMGGYEVAATVAPYARYMVGSEESLPGTGMYYKSWLQALVKNPDMATEDICAGMVDSVIAGALEDEETATCAALTLDKTAAVTRALDALGTALASRDDADVAELRQRMRSFGEFIDDDPTDLVDVQTLCETFAALLPEESAALAEAARGLVLYDSATGDIADEAHGVSVFFPLSTVDEYAEYLEWYPDLPIAQDYAACVSRFGATQQSGRQTGRYGIGEMGQVAAAFADLWSSLKPEATADAARFDGLWSGLRPGAAGSGAFEGLWDGLGARGATTYDGLWTGIA